MKISKFISMRIIRLGISSIMGIGLFGGFLTALETTPAGVALATTTKVVTVYVSGSEGFRTTGSLAYLFFTYLYTTTFGIVSGSPTCTKLETGSNIRTNTLTSGYYTIDPTSCTGLSSNTGYLVNYELTTGDFTVYNAATTVPLPPPPPPSTPGTVLVSVSGSMTFGTITAPKFTETHTNTSGLGTDVTGFLYCTKVLVAGVPTTINPDLSAGTYGITATSCSGLSTNNGIGNSIVYGSSSTGLTVNKFDLVENIETPTTMYGSSPSFAGSISKFPTGGSVHLRVPTCTKLQTGKLISKTLPVGTYTITVSSCSGTTATSSVTVIYTATPLVIIPTMIVVSVSGTSTVISFEGLPVKGVASPSFTVTMSNPRGFKGYVGQVKCTSVLPNKTFPYPIVGKNTLFGTTCSGLTSKTGNYAFSYVGVKNGFTLKPYLLPAKNIGGSMVVGTLKSLSFTANGVSVKTTPLVTLTCKGVKTSTLALTKLAVGTYTIASNSCSVTYKSLLGLPFPATWITFQLSARSGGFKVIK